MCARYHLVTRVETLLSTFMEIQTVGMPQGCELPNFNAEPGQRLPVIIAGVGGRPTWSVMHWGLLPPRKEPIVNARPEELDGHPEYGGLIRTHRCLVPATGFYKWTRPHARSTERIPWAVRLADRRIFTLLGIWKQYLIGSEEVSCFAICTTTPTAELKKLHHSMPALTAEVRDWRFWLEHVDSPIANGLTNNQLMHREELEVTRVSDHVNDQKNNDVLCLTRPD